MNSATSKIFLRIRRYVRDIIHNRGADPTKEESFIINIHYLVCF